jgi:transcriptional regulator with XRE-family HTH domain
MAFHENLRILRLAKGLTQPTLAEKAGIEQSYLSKLENGRSMPSDEVLKRLADALESTPEELMRNGADGEPVPAWKRWALPLGIAAALAAGLGAGWLLRGANDAGGLGVLPGDVAGMSVAERVHALAPKGVKLDEVFIAKGGDAVGVVGRTVDRAGVTEFLAAARRAGLGQAEFVKFTDDDSRFEVRLVARGEADAPRGDGALRHELAKLAGDRVDVRTVIVRPEGGWFVAGTAPDPGAATDFITRVERAGFGRATRRLIGARETPDALIEFEFVVGERG